MLKEFIKENNLSFEEGSRNSTVTVLVSYAQHLGLGQDTLEKELEEQIKEDSFIGSEIDRLFPYCKIKNYKKYWSTPEARNIYKF